MNDDFITYSILFEDIRNLLCNYGCDIDDSLISKFREVYAGYYVFLSEDQRNNILKQLNLSETPNIVLYNRKDNDYTNYTLVNICYDDWGSDTPDTMISRFLNSIKDIKECPKDLYMPFGIKVNRAFVMYITYTSINIETILSSMLNEHFITKNFYDSLISKTKENNKSRTIYCLTYERLFNEDSKTLLDKSSLHLEIFIKKEDIGEL